MQELSSKDRALEDVLQPDPAVRFSLDVAFSEFLALNNTRIPAAMRDDDATLVLREQLDAANAELVCVQSYCRHCQCAVLQKSCCACCMFVLQDRLRARIGEAGGATMVCDRLFLC